MAALRNVPTLAEEQVRAVIEMTHAVGDVIADTREMIAPRQPEVDRPAPAADGPTLEIGL